MAQLLWLHCLTGMFEVYELSADALVEGFRAKRDALRKEYAARRRAFSGFASMDEAAAVYFAAGLARDVFRCVADGDARGLTAEAIAARLSSDMAEVAKVLKQEARYSNVFQHADGGRWQLPAGTGHRGRGLQQLWQPLKECLRSSGGLTLKVQCALRSGLNVTGRLFVS